MSCHPERIIRTLTAVLGLALGPWLAAAVESVPPRDLVYVNNVTGRDAFNGRAPEPGAEQSGPYQTIMRAVRQCRVGALISIANTGEDYRETVSIEKFNKGRAELPLVIDGHGAIVSGLVAVRSNQWVHLREDIYYFLNRVDDDDLTPRSTSNRNIDDGVYGRMPNSNWLGPAKHQGWFTEKEAPDIFFLNGKAGPHVPRLEDLPAGGFFYDTLAATLPQPAGQRCLFFRLPEGAALQDCLVELPLNQGVYVSDDYVTVCNLGSRYSQDDGFAGFWGQNVVLRNIYAGYNCDQGVSFHGNSSTLIDGALIERNAGCGIVDVMSCTTIYRHVTVRENYPGGVKLQGFAHAMYDCRIMGNHGMQVEVNQGASASLKNCLIVGGGTTGNQTALALGYGRLDHCTVVNGAVGVSVAVGARIRSSVIANCATVMTVASNAQANVRIDQSILDAPGLTAPDFLLPDDSPDVKAGENESRPGAKPSAPFTFNAP